MSLLRRDYTRSFLIRVNIRCRFFHLIEAAYTMIVLIKIITKNYEGTGRNFPTRIMTCGTNESTNQISSYGPVALTACDKRGVTKDTVLSLLMITIPRLKKFELCHFRHSSIFFYRGIVIMRRDKTVSFVTPRLSHAVSATGPYEEI